LFDHLDNLECVLDNNAHLEDDQREFGIADIRFGYDNYVLIEKLRARGLLIANNGLKKEII
jgi:hypothetical protein